MAWRRAPAHVARIAPEPPGDWPVPRPAPDAAPDWVAQGTPPSWPPALTAVVGDEGLGARASDLIRYASDASRYRSIPRAVAIPRNIEQVAAVMAVARSTRHAARLPRRRHEPQRPVADRRHPARLPPPLQSGHASKTTARGCGCSRAPCSAASTGAWPATAGALGPDPASTEIACVGGVARQQLRRHALRRPRRLLPHAALADLRARRRHRHRHRRTRRRRALRVLPRPSSRPAWRRSATSCAPTASWPSASRASSRSRTRPATACARSSTATSRSRSSRRLLIGSEGTLAFIGEAVMDTVPLGRHTTLSLSFFEDIDTAVDAVPELVASGASATELMVAPTLIAAAWNMPGTPERWKELPPTSAALLVEFRAEQADELDAPRARRRWRSSPRATRSIRRASAARSSRGRDALARARGHAGPARRDARAGRDDDHRGRVRAAARASPRPPRTCRSCSARHGFLPGVAGHASAGNLHFLLTPNFGEQADLDRYEAFMGELVELIVDRYDGSLKAEHGTGVNMAPLRRARVGSEGDRADVAREAARRPRRGARARDRAHRRRRARTCATSSPRRGSRTSPTSASSAASASRSARAAT